MMPPAKKVKGFLGREEALKITIILLLLIYATACNQVVPPPGLGNKSASQPEGLMLQLKTDKDEYAAGEPVSLGLTVTNLGDQVIRLSFPSSQIYDFVVRRQGQEIWRWSSDKMFAMVLTELKLNPGESRTYHETWPQVDQKGEQVTAGSYELVALLVLQPPILSFPQSIRIRWDKGVRSSNLT